MVSDVGLSDVCRILLLDGVSAAMWNLLPASVRDDQLSVAALRRLLQTAVFATTYACTVELW